MIALEGLWIKMGQYMSSRPDAVPKPWIDKLSQLQDRVPAKSFENVLLTLREAYGPTGGSGASGDEDVDETERRRQSDSTRDLVSDTSSQQNGGGSSSSSGQLQQRRPRPQLRPGASDPFARGGTSRSFGFGPFASIDPVPLATASIAQVHRATLVGGEDVVVKVQHRGIADIFEQDLENAWYLVEEFAREKPQHDYRKVVGEWMKETRRELDFEREGENTERISENLKRAGILEVRLPKVVRRTEMRVLRKRMGGGMMAGTNTMNKNEVVALEAGPLVEKEGTMGDHDEGVLDREEKDRGVVASTLVRKLSTRPTTQTLVLEFIDGVNPTDIEQLENIGVHTQNQRENLIRKITGAFAQQIFIDGLFNGDPHPGNILIEKPHPCPETGEPIHTPILLDFGLVKEIPSKEIRLSFCKLIVAAHEQDISGLLAALREMGLGKMVSLGRPETALQFVQFAFRDSMPQESVKQQLARRPKGEKPEDKVANDKDEADWGLEEEVEDVEASGNAKTSQEADKAALLVEPKIGPGASGVGAVAPGKLHEQVLGEHGDEQQRSGERGQEGQGGPSVDEDQKGVILVGGRSGGQRFSIAVQRLSEEQHNYDGEVQDNSSSASADGIDEVEKGAKQAVADQEKFEDAKDGDALEEEVKDLEGLGTILFLLRVVGLMRGIAVRMKVQHSYLNTMAPMAKKMLREAYAVGYTPIVDDVVDSTKLAPPPADRSPDSLKLADSLRGVAGSLQTRGLLLGGSVCVFGKNKLLLNLGFGELGVADPRPVTPQTLFNGFSCSKVLPVILTHIFVDKGWISSLDDPISRYWPGFERNGKGNITVKMLLEHEAGLSRAFPTKLALRGPGAALRALCNFDKMVSWVASAKPKADEVGVGRYHALSHGWLLGGLLENVAKTRVYSGKNGNGKKGTGNNTTRWRYPELVVDHLLKALRIEDQVRTSLVIDLKSGVPSNDERRTASIALHERHFDRSNDMLGAFARMMNEVKRKNSPDEGEREDGSNPSKDNKTRPTFLNTLGLDPRMFNDPTLRCGLLPAANTHFTALGLARIYQALLSPGELLSKQYLKNIHDECVAVAEENTSQKANAAAQKGTPPYDPPRKWPLGFSAMTNTAGQGLMGFPGLFNDIGYCDPTNGMAVAVLVNQLDLDAQSTRELLREVGRGLGVPWHAWEKEGIVGGGAVGGAASGVVGPPATSAVGR